MDWKDWVIIYSLFHVIYLLDRILNSVSKIHAILFQPIKEQLEAAERIAKKALIEKNKDKEEP